MGRKPAEKAFDAEIRDIIEALISHGFETKVHFPSLWEYIRSRSYERAMEGSVSMYEAGKLLGCSRNSVSCHFNHRKKRLVERGF